MNRGGRGRGPLGYQKGGEAVTTPAVTRRRSTGVHSRVEYTLDQLDRLMLPPSETGPTVTVNTTTE
jgi:hypothetical protein